jgi:hypothetical protein
LGSGKLTSIKLEETSYASSKHSALARRRLNKCKTDEL